MLLLLSPPDHRVPFIPQIRSIVDRLQVYCTYRDRGCAATIAMESKGSHEDTCGYAPVGFVCCPCHPCFDEHVDLQAKMGHLPPSTQGILPQPGLLPASRAAEPRSTCRCTCHALCCVLLTVATPTGLVFHVSPVRGLATTLHPSLFQPSRSVQNDRIAAPCARSKWPRQI